MAREPTDVFDPTHVLLVASGDGSTDAAATAAAVDAVLDHADAVALHLDRAAVEAEHPEVAAAFADALDPVDGDDGRLRGPLDGPEGAPAERDVAGDDFDDVRDALVSFLELTSFHRFVSLERVDAFREDRRLLNYVPDHGRFDLDVDAAADGNALVADVGSAVADHPAGLLPGRTLAAWTEGGTRYELAPPSLCVDDRTCFGLERLDAVALDPAAREVHLSWAVGDGLLASALDALGASRPREFQFAAEDRYATVAAAFELVADGLGIPSRRVSTR